MPGITSLRFHNVRVPVDNRGQIIHPVNTDDLVIKICKDKLGIELSINDIGRSHVIRNRYTVYIFSLYLNQ
jgi:hypothetical protein